MSSRAVLIKDEKISADDVFASLSPQSNSETGETPVANGANAVQNEVQPASETSETYASDGNDENESETHYEQKETAGKGLKFENGDMSADHEEKAVMHKHDVADSHMSFETNKTRMQTGEGLIFVEDFFGLSCRCSFCKKCGLLPRDSTTPEQMSSGSVTPVLNQPQNVKENQNEIKATCGIVHKVVDSQVSQVIRNENFTSKRIDRNSSKGVTEKNERNEQTMKSHQVINNGETPTCSSFDRLIESTQTEPDNPLSNHESEQVIRGKPNPIEIDETDAVNWWGGGIVDANGSKSDENPFAFSGVWDEEVFHGVGQTIYEEAIASAAAGAEATINLTNPHEVESVADFINAKEDTEGLEYYINECLVNAVASLILHDPDEHKDVDSNRSNEKTGPMCSKKAAYDAAERKVGNSISGQQHYRESESYNGARNYGENDMETLSQEINRENFQVEKNSKLMKDPIQTFDDQVFWNEEEAVINFIDNLLSRVANLVNEQTPICNIKNNDTEKNPKHEKYDGNSKDAECDLESGKNDSRKNEVKRIQENEENHNNKNNVEKVPKNDKDNNIKEDTGGNPENGRKDGYIQDVAEDKKNGKFDRNNEDTKTYKDNEEDDGTKDAKKAADHEAATGEDVNEIPQQQLILNEEPEKGKTSHYLVTIEQAGNEVLPDGKTAAQNNANKGLESEIVAKDAAGEEQVDKAENGKITNAGIPMDQGMIEGPAGEQPASNEQENHEVDIIGAAEGYNSSEEEINDRDANNAHEERNEFLDWLFEMNNYTEWSTRRL